MAEPFPVVVQELKYPLHHLSVEHLFPSHASELAGEPIVVEQLNDGSLLVADGRHRLIRAMLRGETTVMCVWKQEID